MEFGYLSLSTVYTVNQLSDFLGEYQDKILQTIVEEVNETYFLPDIQREFIWDENKSEFEEKEYDAPEEQDKVEYLESMMPAFLILEYLGNQSNKLEDII
jgi:hypothetical protein